MKWTHEVPKEPGWYWIRYRSGYGPNEWGTPHPRWGGHYDEESQNHQWWPIPITPPTEETV